MFECGSSPLKLKYIEQSTVLCPTCLLAAHWQPVQLWDRCQESIRTQAGILPVTSSQLGGGWVGGINWGSRNALENVRNMCFLKQTNKKKHIYLFFLQLILFLFLNTKAVIHQFDCWDLETTKLDRDQKWVYLKCQLSFQLVIIPGFSFEELDLFIHSSLIYHGHFSASFPKTVVKDKNTL